MPQQPPTVGLRAVATARLLWLARRERSLPYWPPRRLQRLQDLRARTAAAHAIAHVPFYRDLARRESLVAADFGTLADLERLPLVSAAQLAEEPERFYSEAFAADACFPYQTSGTSGRVRTVRHDLGALVAVRAAGRRERRLLRTLLGDVTKPTILAVMPDHSPAARLRAYLDRHSLVPPSFQPPPLLVPPTRPLEEVVARINAVRPAVVFGYGRTLGSLFRRATAAGLDLWRPRLVRYGGEAMPNDERHLIEHTLGIPVFSGYGAAEAMRLAWECEAHRGLHVNADLVAVRVVDDEGRPLPPGERGEIVISNLVNRATVLLNYRLGDVVALSPSACPCGRTLPLLAAVEGRVSDALLLPDGREVPGLTVIGPLRTVPGVVQVQLVQEDALRFTVRAVLREGTERSAAAAALAAGVRATVGDAAEAAVEILPVLSPEPGGKTPVVLRRWRPEAPQ